MKISYRVITVSILVAALGLVFQAPAQTAEEDLKPQFEGATFFGGAGNQGAPQGSMGMTILNHRLYLSGNDKVVGGQGLAICYTVPPGESPVWAFRWPSQKGRGTSWNDQALRDVAVTDEGVYFAGSVFLTDPPGIEAVVAKFPLSGPNGPEIGGALWVVRPRFFSYGWITIFHGVIAAQEGTETFLYATGHSQSDGSNNTAVLAKMDTSGKVLWTTVLGDPKSYQWSQGDSLVAMNGHVYVVGYVHYPSTSTSARPHAGIWKVSPSGDVVWYKTSLQPIPQNAALPLSGVALDDHLYVACGLEKGPFGGLSDALILKYSADGAQVWAKEWGGTNGDVACGIATDGKCLYVVGETASQGSGKKDAFLLQVKPENGEILAALTYGGPGDDVARCVKVKGKDLFVLGDSNSFTQGGNAAGESDLMLLRYLVKPHVTVISVPIDVKPGEKAPNPINLKSKGKIPVAILSTKEFHAPVVVDRATLTFGRTGQEKSMTSQPCGVEDVNKDGLADLVAHFENQLTLFQAGDINGILRGKTLTGKLFQGMDLIKVVPPEKGMKEEKPKIEKPFTPPVVRQPSPGQPPSSGVLRPKKGEVPSLKEGEVAY